MGGGAGQVREDERRRWGEAVRGSGEERWVLAGKMSRKIMDDGQVS